MDKGQAEAARQGDKGAFDALVRAYERSLRGFIARHVAPNAVDDVLQETWLAAWTGISGYKGQSRFKGWLFGIALHKCRDYQRAQGRAPRVTLLTEDTEDASTAAAERPSAAGSSSALAGGDFAAQVDLRHAVGAALNTLPETQREVLELYYYAQITLAEISAVTGRNESTVKYQFYRAHAQVRQQLRGLYGEEETMQQQQRLGKNKSI